MLREVRGNMLLRGAIAALTFASLLTHASALVFSSGSMGRATGLRAVSLGKWMARSSVRRNIVTSSRISSLRRPPRFDEHGSRMMSPDIPPDKGKFVKLGGAEDAQSFGPRCILASGVTLEESKVIRLILEEDAQRKEDTPLVVLTPEIADQRVGDVLMDASVIALLQEKDDNCPGPPLALSTSPVILISGFTNQELRTFVARFRHNTGIRAAFAKAVPNAMTKTVARLCGEIAQDHADALAGELQGKGE